MIDVASAAVQKLELRNKLAWAEQGGCRFDFGPKSCLVASGNGRSMLVSRLHNRWFPLVRAFVSDHDRLAWHNKTQWYSACTLVIVGLLLFLLGSEMFEMVCFTGVSRATTWEVVLKLSSEQ